ncbi:LysR family transcriptional regulator [Pseudodesulfovibrio cashew]|nr:LysR family transcriptional regulator [Pseudodesulfovibrio cashew]
MTQLAPDVLRTFVSAADTGSFTRAGDAVHRTQSAVSMQIKRLETELGKTLFVREGRGVTLTAEGEILYRFARRLLALHDEALAAIGTPGVKGVVRFGAPEDYASLHLPAILKRFASSHPLIEVEVYCDASPTLRERFARRELDVMLATGEPASDAHTHRLDLAWAVADRGEALEKRPLPLALFHAGCLYRRNALAALETAGIEYRIAYGSPSMAGVLAAVQAGLAVAPVTRNCRAPGCRRVTAKEGLPSIAPVAMELHKAETENEAADTFHSFIADMLSGEEWNA